MMRTPTTFSSLRGYESRDESRDRTIKLYVNDAISGSSCSSSTLANAKSSDQLKRTLASDHDLKDFLPRILSHPSDFLTAEHAAMHFDRMGMLLDGKTNQEKDDLQVLEVKLGDTFRRSCVILKCSRNTLIKKQAPNV